MNRVNVICLGVANMEQSLKFYRDALGFQTTEKENNPPVVFFDTPGTKFELFPIVNLVQDINPDLSVSKDQSYFKGMTLAYNVAQKEEVNQIIELAKSAGATIIKEPQDVFWGGYHAYFSDFDGYVWEVAGGPDFKCDENGMLIF